MLILIMRIKLDHINLTHTKFLVKKISVHHINYVRKTNVGELFILCQVLVESLKED